MTPTKEESVVYLVSEELIDGVSNSSNLFLYHYKDYKKALEKLQELVSYRLFKYNRWKLNKINEENYIFERGQETIKLWLKVYKLF